MRTLATAGSSSSRSSPPRVRPHRKPDTILTPLANPDRRSVPRGRGPRHHQRPHRRPGTRARIARFAGPGTKLIDVAGATVIPGLIDNHFHFTRGVETWHQQARFEGVDTRREALQILATKAAACEPGEWIMVQGGWTPRQFADAPGGFTLEELDRAAPENPLFVQEGYGEVYANSLALKAVGLDPAGGARRTAQGLVSFQPPYGAVRRHAQTTPAQRDQNLTDSCTSSNVGLTGVYSLGQSDSWPRVRPRARCR